LKVVFIGAGSYVFGPSVLAQTYLEEHLQNVHLALVDPDLVTIELLAPVGKRMASEHQVSTTITTHTNRAEALKDADFVICSASPQMQSRTATDWSIIDRYLPGHQKSEFGGIAGISYSLRQIELLTSIADDMHRLCPDAWLLDVSNPLPRVAQAAAEHGIKTAGFCVVSVSVYGMLWEIFYGQQIPFPYNEARRQWNLTTAGVNHLAWLLELRGRDSGIDLQPQLREIAKQGRTVSGNPVSLNLLNETGYLLTPGDEHTQDFLTPSADSPKSDHSPWHGNSEQRQQRLDLLRRIGDGDVSWDNLLIGAAWEKPMQFIRALIGGDPAEFHSMNLRNDKYQVSNLPAHVFVETPCRVTAGRVQPQFVTLPESVLPLCERTVRVTDTIVRAAEKRSLSLVHEAVLLDPTVLDKAAGLTAIDACIHAHSDILPLYA
jgi:alpha-galactosidase